MCISSSSGNWWINVERWSRGLPLSGGKLVEMARHRKRPIFSRFWLKTVLLGLLGKSMECESSQQGRAPSFSPPTREAPGVHPGALVTPSTSGWRGGGGGRKHDHRKHGSLLLGLLAVTTTGLPPISRRQLCRAYHRLVGQPTRAQLFFANTISSALLFRANSFGISCSPRFSKSICMQPKSNAVFTSLPYPRAW